MGDGGLDDPPPTQRTYSEAFHELFPYFLSIGMTEEQYWDKDCRLVRDFYEAHKLRLQRENQILWLQGIYVLEALQSVASSFGRKGSKRHAYPKEPIPLAGQEEEKKPAKDLGDGTRAARQYMEIFMVRYNAEMKRRESEVNSGGDHDRRPGD